MLAKLLSQLQKQQIDLENPDSGLTAVLELGWDSFNEATQQIAMVLSLFAPAPVPQAMLERALYNVWDEMTTNRENISTACSRLIQRHWLQLIDENTYRLHFSIRVYLQTKLNQFPDGNRLKQAFCEAMVIFAKQLSDPPPVKECVAFAPAIPHIAEAVTTWQAWLTDESIVFPYFCLGRFYTAQGAFDQATDWYQLCLTIARSRLGNEHPAIAANLTHLANLYYTQDRYQEAESLYRQALQLLQQVLGEGHPAVAISHTNLANLYKAQGRYSEAEPQALAMSQPLLGQERKEVFGTLSKIAAELERFDASIDVIDCTQAKRAIEAALGAARVLLGAMTVEVFYMSKKLDTAPTGDAVLPTEIPYCFRFAKSLDENDENAVGKEKRDHYNPEDDGPWTWSYKRNVAVWIEDRSVEYVNGTSVPGPRYTEPVSMEHRRAMENKAAQDEKDRTIERQHNIFSYSVNAVIVIPFSYNLGGTFIGNTFNRDDSDRGLISHQANGFISFEFKDPKRYDPDQLRQLLRIRESVADLIWKSYAWRDSLNGTSYVVSQFEQECKEISRNAPFGKTGLVFLNREDNEGFTTLVSTAFAERGIAMQTYDGRLDEIGLWQTDGDIASRIRNVHFAIFDLTEENLAVDVLLGVMFAEKKPCLILHDHDKVQRHPLVGNLEEAARNRRGTNQLLELWFYEAQPNKQGYLFFRRSNEERREWITVWEGFLQKVMRISEIFRMAADGRSPREN